MHVNNVWLSFRDWILRKKVLITRSYSARLPCICWRLDRFLRLKRNFLCRSVGAKPDVGIRSCIAGQISRKCQVHPRNELGPVTVSGALSAGHRKRTRHHTTHKGFNIRIYIRQMISTGVNLGFKLVRVSLSFQN
jgi:hypothetical protein